MVFNDSGAKAPLSIGKSLSRRGRYIDAIQYYQRASLMAISSPFKDKSKRWTLCPWAEKGYIENSTHNFIYCPIPKNACSSFKRLSVQLSSIKHKDSVLSLPDNLLHSYVDHHLTFFARFTRHEAQSILNNDKYFRFVIVRNPWTRILSAYLDKFVRSRKLDMDYPQDLIKRVIEAVYDTSNKSTDYSKSITFRQFVEYVLERDDDLLEGHWKSQSFYLGSNKFDFIAHLENIKEDFRYIKQMIKCETQIEASNSNKREAKRLYPLSGQKPIFDSSSSVNACDLYPAEILQLSRIPDNNLFYDIKLIDQVAQRYEQDIVGFKYENIL